MGSPQAASSPSGSDTDPDPPHPGGEVSRRQMLGEVRAGLSAAQKTLPSKYFYDERGSRLFDRITRLPEYYPTRTEQTLLDRWVPEWVDALRPRSLVELGAGSAQKTRTILDAMVAACGGGVYVPVDVSETFLRQTARRLKDEYPSLRVAPAVSDIGRELHLPPVPHPVLHAFLGSTIGNFAEGEAVALLGRIARAMESGDRLLLGVDLKKDPAILEAAYNDAQGVTAAFNRNVLSVLNAELGANFLPGAFAHRAVWVEGDDRIEMHLVAERPMTVEIPGMGAVSLDEGESIRTEISGKFDRPRVERIVGDAGLEVVEWAADGEMPYALVLAAAVGCEG